jgi:hypothetical protein
MFEITGWLVGMNHHHYMKGEGLAHEAHVS